MRRVSRLLGCHRKRRRENSRAIGKKLFITREKEFCIKKRERGGGRGFFPPEQGNDGTRKRNLGGSTQKREGDEINSIRCHEKEYISPTGFFVCYVGGRGEAVAEICQPNERKEF